MLYTVLRPDAGDALIDGCSVVREPLAAAARLGVLPHGAGIYPNLTARENILYFGALQGLPRAARRARTAELIELLEMEEFADRLARGFSQGQRVKTALARALVHRPRNLVLDEPTNGLDVMAVRTLRRCCVQLRDAGHCVLFSSHVMQEVSALCDEVVVIAARRGAARSGTPGADPRPHRRRQSRGGLRAPHRRGGSELPCAPSSRSSSRSFARTCASGARCSPRCCSGRLLGPLLFAGGLSLRLERGVEEGERPLTLAVAHAERAPNLLGFLRQYGVTVTPVDYDADAGARRGAGADRRRRCWRCEPDFAARLAAGAPAPLELYADSSDSPPRATARACAGCISRIRCAPGAAAHRGARHRSARALADRACRTSTSRRRRRARCWCSARSATWCCSPC